MSENPTITELMERLSEISSDIHQTHQSIQQRFDRYTALHQLFSEQVSKLTDAVDS